jgi:cell shape-determining protein MreC
MNKLKLLIVLIIFVISIVFVPPKQEGFTSYFRQTVRPHLRTFRSAQETFTSHFNTNFKDFGRRLGLF